MTASHRFVTAGNGLSVVRWPGLDELGVIDALVTTAHGGVSTGSLASLNLGLHVGDDPANVVENRRRAAGALGLQLDDMAFCHQTHDTTVGVVTLADRGRGARSDADTFAATDALVTAEVGVGLAVMVADCVPIVLVDPHARVLGCVHAGWGGTLKGITPAAVQAMVDLGADPARIVAGIGPSISPDVYQVGDEVHQAALETFGDRVDRVIQPDGTGRWLFDLWEANTILLTDAGVSRDQVHLAGLCTSDERFFSHRFATKAGTAPCGRFAAIARLCMA